jgi:lipopolysaccharide biosynthesis glycosyltransferase
MNKVYIGYDSKQPAAFYACLKSLQSNTKETYEAHALIQSELRENGDYTRAIDPLSSTEFSFTRFLIPHLCMHKGWALFCDSDFIFLEDVNELFSLADERYAVMVCQHDYNPTNSIKMNGQTQHLYARKNWSSLVLWNCAHPSNAALTANVVNQQSGSYLHQFQWLADYEIGSIPLQWNWLVDWYKEPDDGTPKALHYTEGGPWLDAYKNCSYANEWLKYS